MKWLYHLHQYNCVLISAIKKDKRVTKNKFLDFQNIVSAHKTHVIAILIITESCSHLESFQVKLNSFHYAPKTLQRV